MAVIELSEIRKKFIMGGEEIRALDGVSFSIEAGEFVAITGSSGCGKSTLMNLLGLLDQPLSGTYVLDGKPVASLSDDERANIRNQKIGFVFQSFNLLPRANALRNVEMPLIYSASWDPAFSAQSCRTRAVASLKQVGLEDRMDHLPSELSGGQRQRVAIARALVNSPRVLLADEPTGNLDSRVGDEIMQLFKELNRNGATVVLVTHDPNIADQASRVILMADGKIKEDRKGRR
jgi:ABC-type lipoprotein export system ATPase subunit